MLHEFQPLSKGQLDHIDALRNAHHPPERLQLKAPPIQLPGEPIQGCDSSLY
jgi:hypothetical protein